MPSDREAIVLVMNVRAISDGLALMCELPDGRRFAVPSRLIGPQSQVRCPGDVGTLAVPQWFASDHNLPISD